ncbi:MAG: 2-hydroxyacid dehydrogenase [Chloroflexi bacterium]|nr:2-hydroxyacid dehydrogenase [Chloroflexota bacterium]
MTKRAMVLSEFDADAIPGLEKLGYEVVLGGWGQTRHTLSEEALIDLVGDVALLVVEVEQVTAKVIAAAPQLKYIAVCRGVPVNVDVAAATARGIPVLNTPARNADSVADFALGLILVLGRNICRADRHVREYGWHVDGEIPYFHFRGPELAGKTLGLVGCGAIGRGLARRARALGMIVAIYDPYLSQEALGDLGQLTSLDPVLSQSDFISLHVPVTPETRGMIGGAELRRMKRSAYLINTARAAIIDEQALFAALQEEQIAGAALDVFWQEPLPPDSPWRELDNVLLTPHLAGASDDVKVHHSAMIVENVRALQQGSRPSRIVNPEVLY